MSLNLDIYKYFSHWEILFVYLFISPWNFILSYLKNFALTYLGSILHYSSYQFIVTFILATFLTTL